MSDKSADAQRVNVAVQTAAAAPSDPSPGVLESTSVNIPVLSRAAPHARAFVAEAERALSADKAILVEFDGPTPQAGDASVFDLNGWTQAMDESGFRSVVAVLEADGGYRRNDPITLDLRGGGAPGVLARAAADVAYSPLAASSLGEGVAFEPVWSAFIPAAPFAQLDTGADPESPAQR